MRLWSIFGHFALMSLVAVGGASSTLPEMHRFLVESTQLLTHDQFMSLYALSQAAPGPNVLFVALFGQQIGGVAGIIVAVAGLCLPAAAIALAFEALAGYRHDATWPALVRRGLSPLSIGLLLATGWLLAATPHSAAATNWGAPLLSGLAAAVTLARPRWHPLWLIAVGATLGAAQLL